MKKKKESDMYGRNLNERRVLFQRVCKHCENTYMTTARYGKVCDDCLERRHQIMLKKNRNEKAKNKPTI